MGILSGESNTSSRNSGLSQAAVQKLLAAPKPKARTANQTIVSQNQDPRAQEAFASLPTNPGSQPNGQPNFKSEPTDNAGSLQQLHYQTQANLAQPGLVANAQAFDNQMAAHRAAEAAAASNIATPGAEAWQSGSGGARSGGAAATMPAVTAPIAPVQPGARTNNNATPIPAGGPQAVEGIGVGSTGGASSTEGLGHGQGGSFGQFRNRTNRRNPRESLSLTPEELKKAAAARMGL